MKNIMKFEKGATLVEAVASLLIFSVGILGVAALQATSLSRGDDVKQRSLAIWKAQELADRIRATRTIDNPAGELAAYRGVIGNDVASILSYDETDDFACPNAAPANCDDRPGNAAASCSVNEMVNFDVWSVVCDPTTGASDEIIANQDGINKLKSLDIAITPGGAAGEHYLYFSWLSRAADKNDSLQREDGAVRMVETQLCGELRQVDSRLDTYCLRFF